MNFTAILTISFVTLLVLSLIVTIINYFIKVHKLHKIANYTWIISIIALIILFYRTIYMEWYIDLSYSDDNKSVQNLIENLEWSGAND